MIVVTPPRREEEVLAPVRQDAAPGDLLESILEWSEQCVVHLCGCNCSC